jgi:hypothetical protein
LCFHFFLAHWVYVYTTDTNLELSPGGLGGQCCGLVWSIQWQRKRLYRYIFIGQLNTTASCSECTHNRVFKNTFSNMSANSFYQHCW